MKKKKNHQRKHSLLVSNQPSPAAGLIHRVQVDTFIKMEPGASMFNLVCSEEAAQHFFESLVTAQLNAKGAALGNAPAATPSAPNTLGLSPTEREEQPVRVFDHSAEQLEKSLQLSEEQWRTIHYLTRRFCFFYNHPDEWRQKLLSVCYTGSSRDFFSKIRSFFDMECEDEGGREVVFREIDVKKALVSLVAEEVCHRDKSGFSMKNISRKINEAIANQRLNKKRSRM